MQQKAEAEKQEEEVKESCSQDKNPNQHYL